MAQNLVALWNLALGAVGSRARITQEDQHSFEADVIRRWYEPVRDTIFCAAHWSSVRGVSSLPLLKERDFNLTWQEGDPDHPWAFAYGLPVDFLASRYLDSYQMFELSISGSTRVLLCNASVATLIYTKKQSNVGIWSPDLYMAVARGLSAAICLELNGKMQRAMNAQRSANEAILTARINNANEQETDFDALPDWLIARGVGLTSQASRYIQPTGPLLAVVQTSDT
jgi:hypothetical protein